MALKITYWTASRLNPNIPGSVIYEESRTISSSSQQSGATPANAMFVSIRNTETGDVSYDYSSANPTAIATPASSNTSLTIATGERFWADAIPGYKFAAITAI
jgi:hypothetical protein